MRRVALGIGLGFLALAQAGMAVSEPVDGALAKKTLYKADALEVAAVTVTGVSETLAQQIEKVVKEASSRGYILTLAASGFSYYGAMAIPVEIEPLTAENITISSNHHSPAAAQVYARGKCEAAHDGPCAVIALLQPRRFKPQDFTLNRDASAAFFDTWAKVDGAKFLAYSPSGSAWVMARSEEVAIARCNEKAEVADCVIGVAGD